MFWSFLGRISSLEEEVKNGKSALVKLEMEKRQLQEKLTDLEKVTALLSEHWCYILTEFLNVRFYYLRRGDKIYVQNKPCFQCLFFFFEFFVYCFCNLRSEGKKDIISLMIIIHCTSKVHNNVLQCVA